MQHPFVALKPEYSQLLTAMAVRPECKSLVDHVAVKLLGYKSRYQPVSDANGVPVIFIAACFEREASSNFTRNPAQGWPLSSTSKWIPHNGPFRTWYDAAITAYHLNGLDRVGAGKWTWELLCFYGELFNGFGPRDYHHMHTSYLWGGTNIQTRGKYTSDGVFDASKMDEQLGIIPVMRRMVEIDPTLALPFVVAPPIASGIAAGGEGSDTKFVQASLNKLGINPPLAEDGNYGRQTQHAVTSFQRDWGITVDGIAGDQTIKALRDATAALEKESA